MKRIIIIFGIALGLLGIGVAQASAAPAAKPSAKYTITVEFDSNVPNQWPRNALDGWETGTSLNFVRGTCSGQSMCINVHTWEFTLCSAGAVGCAEVGVLKTETCDLYLNPAAIDGTYGDLNRRVLTGIIVHEGGHCLGLDHQDPAVDQRSVMLSMISPTSPIYKPSSLDRQNVNALWP